MQILSEQGVPTPVQSLADVGLISKAVTSFKLGRVADRNNDGKVMFGGLDSSKFYVNTLVTFDNVNTQGFWEGAFSDVTVNEQSLGLGGRTAILDTGTVRLFVFCPFNTVFLLEILSTFFDRPSSSLPMPMQRLCMPRSQVLPQTAKTDSPSHAPPMLSLC